eukprot:15361798-Alexandrium_andersonii.AAC.1
MLAAGAARSLAPAPLLAISRDEVRAALRIRRCLRRPRLAVAASTAAALVVGLGLGLCPRLRT